MDLMPRKTSRIQHINFVREMINKRLPWCLQFKSNRSMFCCCCSHKTANFTVTFMIERYWIEFKTNWKKQVGFAHKGLKHMRGIKWKMGRGEYYKHRAQAKRNFATLFYLSVESRIPKDTRNHDRRCDWHF